MANMENRIDAFIVENGLDEDIKDALIELVNGCFGDYVGHMSKEWLTTAISSKKESTPKAKKERLVNPSDATAIEELRKCTTLTMNDYCKNNGLKVGGNKREIMERVWRHIQGDSSDDDLSRASKPKKVKPTKESHSCFACNAKGAPCGIAATEEYCGHWFCFHHIDDAEKLVAAKNPTEPEPDSEPEDESDDDESDDEPEPEPEPKPKKPVSKRPTVKK
jgi:hypothetical protein